MSLFKATRKWPYHVSAGGLVYEIHDGQRRYALLYRQPGNGYAHANWNLPKGTLEDDESLTAGALREVKEETGLDCKIEAYLGATHRKVKFKRIVGEILYDKTTHYFLMRYVDGNHENMDAEHDELQWFSTEEAQKKLSDPKRNKAEDEIVSRAEEYFKQ